MQTRVLKKMINGSITHKKSLSWIVLPDSSLIIECEGNLSRMMDVINLTTSDTVIVTVVISSPTNPNPIDNNLLHVFLPLTIVVLGATGVIGTMITIIRKRKG